jgi:hypothetical protein
MRKLRKTEKPCVKNKNLAGKLLLVANTTQKAARHGYFGTC